MNANVKSESTSAPEELYFASAEKWLHILEEGYSDAHRPTSELRRMHIELLNTLLVAAAHPTVPHQCLSIHGTLVQGLSLLVVAANAPIGGDPSSGNLLSQVSTCLQQVWEYLEQLRDRQAVHDRFYKQLSNLLTSRASTNGKPAFPDSEVMNSDN